MVFALGFASGIPARPGVAAQATAGLGSLRGRVAIQRTVTAPVRRPGIADFGTSAQPEVPDLPRAIVFLESPDVPETSVLRSQPLQPGRARMDQRNETFVPHVLAIDVGTRVDFPNNDQTFHNVFSLSKAKHFDLGRYGRNQSKTIRFDKPGVVRVFCDIHSHMNAFVVVFNHPYHALTDDDGRYRIDNIPAGTYGVTAWHEGSARDMRSVTIPPGGGVVDLDLLVQ
jgi:plastocyanin